MIWSGVMPALTTPFDEAMKVEHGFLAQHAAWQLGNGCTGPRWSTRRRWPS
jgi:dihydrodipicolinate synthase/N-acetylneuraminate lyase